MRIKLVLVAVLSLSISCFAESGEDQSKPLPAADQVGNISTGNEQPVQIKVEKKKSKSQPSQEEINVDKQSLMIDYCRKHTC
ncbi:hypothetical protein ABO04_08665 [Nitrosomonas sp. HPC101]|uniref:hypothetical protein n=1 Tax=Nitrosomonas sp. HPC101 TaxID=1658667 RepID=UPI0013700BD6|nr:hypothetical protein [Nitrosomonas sp. HPC101]MXS85978.1 hypothetical protein [Nitrosomonas sp. HPC101]